MTIANIYIKNDNLANDPISGAVVGLYNTSGTFITQGTTNGSGLVSFMLTLPQYRLYVYKDGFSLPNQPHLLNVTLSASTIVYELIGHLRGLPESLDPLMCRISGQALNTLEKTKKFTSLTLFHDYPYTVQNKFIANLPVATESNANGYFEFDAFRKTKYKSGYGLDQDFCLLIVPDRASLDLNSFLYPVHSSLSVTSSSIAVSKDEVENIPLTAVYTDYSTNVDRGYYTHWSKLQIENSDSSVAAVGTSGSSYLAIQGLSTGITTITFTRKLDHCLVMNPEPSFTSPTITIIVS